ncbi:hypothetical protein [Mongoliimonas terrestris]|uniref:hypothetical protein n=1 Tax=Mongoliimonas terrestris TaxID=1709001 RepID=UPI000A72C129|nr:hypothetical protein [Mongoliimonas terrestris]
MAKTVRDPVERPGSTGSAPSGARGSVDKADQKGRAAPKTPEQEAADRRRARTGFVTSIAVTALAIGALIWRLGS